MAIRSSKHATATAQTITLSGGLNHALPPFDIADFELTQALNVVYQPGSGVLTVGPGARFVAQSEGQAPIRALHYYRKDSATSFWVAAFGGKLWALTTAGAWQELATLTSDAVAPSMTTFHGRLLVADGSASGLRAWDGAAPQAAFIAGSPPKPTLVDAVANRVAVNSAGDLDAVYLSAPFDETDWDLNGQAAAVRCGYMDGLEVSAWAVLGGASLIVSKRGAQADMLYRFDLAGLTASWQVSQPLTRSHAALHGRAMVQAGNEVYFFDRFGLCSLRGVVEFGTVKGEAHVAPLMGGRINPWLTASGLTDVSHMAYLPELGAVAAAMKGSSLVVLYHVAGQGFTTLDLGLSVQAFATGRDPSGKTVTRLAAGDAVYELATDQSVVEVSPGVTRPLSVCVTTKAFSVPLAELILRRASLRTRGITSYEATLSLVDQADGSSIQLLSVSGDKGFALLSELPDRYLDWTEGIGPLAAGPRDDASRVRQRAPALQFRLSSANGRFEIANLSFEAASVARG